MNPSPGDADEFGPAVVAATAPLAEGVVEDVALGVADGWTAAQPIATQDHSRSKRLVIGRV